MSKNLSEQKHIYPHCSNCRAILMDIMITSEKFDFETKIQATCPFCGDKSFVHIIKGLFYRGGYGKIKDDDEDQDVPSTIIDNVIEDGDLYLFKVIKANENAKPIRANC